MPTDKAQIVDQKNGVICLVIMSMPRVPIIKMSQLVKVWTKYVSVPERPC